MIRDLFARRKISESVARRREETSELNRLIADALKAVEEAEQRSGPLAGAPEHEVAARLQSWLAENSRRLEKLGMQEVKFDEHDLLGWAGSLLSWLRGLKKHEIVRPTGGPESLPNQVKIALAGDWGSGLYAAPDVANAIESEGCGVAIHLGDVYYSGTEKEVRDRFLKFWPQKPGMISRALNSNHEMYSGGYGYFNLTLPRSRSKRSKIFCERRSGRRIFSATSRSSFRRSRASQTSLNPPTPSSFTS